MMTTKLTINSTDEELLERFQSLRRQACGEEAGESTMSPSEAVEAEEWEFVRHLTDSTTGHGEAVLARDGDNLYVVMDIHGPWAIEVA